MPYSLHGLDADMREKIVNYQLRSQRLSETAAPGPDTIH